MERDSEPNGRSTRREYVKYGGTLVGGGLLAGCAGDGGTGTATDADGSTSAAPVTETEGPTAASGESDTTEGSPYTVSMAPAGDVQFDDVPETWMAYFSTYGDMGIALGQLSGLEALIFTENWPDQFFEYLPGVDVSFDDVRQIMANGEIDKEIFYELDLDVHLLDPNFISLLDDSWGSADFQEIEANIGPIIGNVSRRRNDDWHDYEYYSLYEAFEKIAQVFREEDRYRAFAEIHDSFIGDIRSRLPPEDERPEVGLLSVNSEFEAGTFSWYKIDNGNGKQQYNDLGIGDAFASIDRDSNAHFDYEALLDIDPDLLVFQYGVSHVSESEFGEKMETLRNHSVGRRLSAVRNDRLYPGGTAYQGPIINLFQTEMAAKQFYPEEFGEWNGYETFADESNWLFDRHRVADVVNGEF